MASCDANTSSNVTLYFDNLDLTNVVVSLIMPLALHDAEADANGIT